MRSDEENFLYQYYLQQAGSGMGTIYQGPIYQTGHGVGSFLAKVYRTVFPYIKKGAKKIGKEFLKTGADIVQDMTDENIPFKEALKKRSKEALNRMTTGGAYKRSQIPVISHSSAKRVKRNTAKASIKKASSAQKLKRKNKNNKKVERDIFQE